jgi:uncharacterized membrane protein YoaK (UPF0700 family)
MSGKMLMKENEFSPIGKAATILLITLIAISAVINILRHEVPHPFASIISLVGFTLFFIAKVKVIRNVKIISFGTKYMTENLSNVYRLGYWLMIFGILLTFT